MLLKEIIINVKLLLPPRPHTLKWFIALIPQQFAKSYDVLLNIMPNTVNSYV